MKVDLDKLEALAKAASPGPWKWWTSNSRMRLTGANTCDGGIVDAIERHDGADVAVSRENAEYIAAASPDVMLALVEKIRRYKRALRSGVDDGQACLLCGDLGTGCEETCDLAAENYTP